MNITGNHSDEKRLLDGLNPEQVDAVTTVKGPLLVLAGAGTGKTLVITRRIAHLISRNVPAENILAVTFTRKAAAEMRERIQLLLGSSALAVTICTFHSLGLRMLKEHGHRLGLSPRIVIVDTAEQLKLLETILDEVDPEGHFTALNLLSRISFAKNRGVMPEDYLRRELDEMSRRAVLVYARYQQELRKRQALDLDDLVSLPLLLFGASERVRNIYLRRFRYILIDEYQDTNRSQYLLTRNLVGEERNVCVVGDDDQSIYRFRGAEVGNILRFEADFSGAKVVLLEKNYRCTEPILALANSVIGRAEKRYRKQLISTVGTGVPVRWKSTANDEAELNFVVREIKRRTEEGMPYSSVAVLHRVQSELRAIETVLKKAEVPFGKAAQGVVTMTVHQAKGLEFPLVILPAVEEHYVPHFHALQEGPAAIAEERRLFYVAITRAKEELLITSAGARGGHAREPSRFLREVSDTGVLHRL